MEIKKNVGTIDALFRLIIGLTGLAWGTARMSHHPLRSGPIIVLLLSAMKVAEGITRFCPMLYLLGVNTERLPREKNKVPYRISRFPRRDQGRSLHES